MRLPESLANALNPQGSRIYGNVDGAETLICEVFWAREIAAQDEAPASTSLFYGNIKPGGLIGVIHFLIMERYVRDYRSQMLKPGYYTMRYAAMPEGTNGSKLDFALLSPVTADRNPAPVPSLDELMRQGRLSSHTKRPSMMSLVEVDTDHSFPSLITDEEGTSMLQVKLGVKSSQFRKSGQPRELALALIVITAIPEDLGD